MIELNEGRVKEILRCRTTLLSQIHNRLISLHHELDETEQLISEIALSSVKMDGDTGGKNSGLKKDLSDVMEAHQKLSQIREREVRILMDELVKEESQINRVWVCFNALSGDEFKVLEHLYVRNLPYKAVEEESGVSHGTFESIRRRGIRFIIRMYNSDLQNIEIIRKSGTHIDSHPGLKDTYSGGHGKGKRNKKSKRRNQEYQQLKLDLDN